MKLLETLHSGEYKRVVIVSHSLGTILALDLLSYFWATKAQARTVSEESTDFDALCQLEKAAANIVRENPNKDSLEEFYQAQRNLSDHLAASNRPLEARWLITDLITLGSPLCHAELLLAYDKADLKHRMASREIPESPPFRESADPKVIKRARETGKLPIAAPEEKTRLMCFPNSDTTWQLHHAAPFSAVRWTNIYDESKWIWRGDIISGPLGATLGPAIIDINIADHQKHISWIFTHRKYWKIDGHKWRIKILQYAVNLLHRRKSDPPIF
ncbi:hypothetical protein [Ferrovibrio sp.]|uniref:hypothetical protein n=1 Tax=Ferrovibrio sp. TaxID=1917215 RepID=UPI0035AEE967